MKFSIVFFSALIIAGCAATGHLNTLSGRPEITVHSTTKEVAHQCAGWLLQNSYQIDQQNDFLVSGTKDVTSGFTSFTTAGTDRQRTAFNFIDRDSGAVTIYANRTVVQQRPATYGATTTTGFLGSSGGSSVEKPIDSQDDMDELQLILNKSPLHLSIKF